MSWDGRDRRAHPRVAAAFRLTLAIEVDLGGSPPAYGVTVNISRGGMLAAVDRSLPVAAHCSIRFLDADGRARPVETTGRVLRVAQREDGFAVGIMFDEPLDALEVEPTLWKKPRIFGRRRD